MRRTTQHCEVIIVDDVILGVNLGYDFAAEHEWGFKWAARYLGRPAAATRDLLGIKARTTTTVKPEFALELVEHDGELWLRGKVLYGFEKEGLLAELATDPKKRSHYSNELASNWGDKPIRAGWNTDGGFCVVGKSDDAKEAIRIVHKALLGGACFMLQSGGVFGAGGLKMLDARLIPGDVDAEMSTADVSGLDLTDAVAATGIKDRLEAAGLRYYALSPRWQDEAKGTFHFWLNPQDQQANNYGWMTIADLDDWIAGKGKIPMRRARA